MYEYVCAYSYRMFFHMVKNNNKENNKKKLMVVGDWSGGVTGNGESYIAKKGKVNTWKLWVGWVARREGNLLTLGS